MTYSLRSEKMRDTTKKSVSNSMNSFVRICFSSVSYVFRARERILVLLHALRSFPFMILRTPGRRYTFLTLQRGIILVFLGRAAVSRVKRAKRREKGTIMQPRFGVCYTYPLPVPPIATFSSVRRDCAPGDTVESVTFSRSREQQQRRKRPTKTFLGCSRARVCANVNAADDIVGRCKDKVNNKWGNRISRAHSTAARRARERNDIYSR